MTDHSFRHREYGEPTAVYRYSDHHIVCRYQHAGKKQILPWSLIDGRWQSKSAEKPRPLYNSQALVNGAKVVVVEGEKCVDHLKALATSRIPICWPGGAQAVKHADWTALYGRDVLLFPDHDDPGHKCMVWLAGELLKHGSKVSVVRHTADDLPEGWDIADTTWSKAELNEWLAGRIQVVDNLAPEGPSAPRETLEPRRGKPRGRQDGAPSSGRDVIDGNTGSVFVSWERLGLELTSNGAPHPHLANIQKILSGHPELVGRIWYDEFHERVFQTLFQAQPEEWQDSHDVRLTVWIQNCLRLSKVGHQNVRLAVEDYARLNVRNEVREWMEGLSWDGHERLPSVMAKGFGAEQNEYTAAVGRCWFVSMAARTFEPGCKVDTMPVFEGAQGTRKSSSLAILGGKWFGEMHEDMTSKDFLQNLRGKLLIEISELHAFRRSDINKIKGIISCAIDRYRESYGRRACDHPRRGVWAGTTNQTAWVEDDTGARRFWPIACGVIDHNYLKTYRGQLFAEAVVRYKAGEAWWDINEELARKEQDARRERDVWTTPIMQYCNGKPEVTVGEIMNQVLSIPLKDRSKSDQLRIGSILRVAGWVRVQAWRDGENVKAWVPSVAKMST